jgi:3-mercaptopyruvate sulfurtransferase SseA
VARFLLRLYGYRNTSLLEGFLEDWKKAGLPLERQRRAAGSRRAPMAAMRG